MIRSSSAMKPAALVAFSVFAAATATAQDKPIKLDKETMDKAKGALEQLMGKAKDAVEKSDDKGGRELWARSKDSLTMPREAYVKKADSAIKTMEAELAALAESGSTLVSREYFKTRMESLKQHVEYCRRDLERLQGAETDEAFRVKQRAFDRGLGFLGDHIELTLEEAGL